MLMEFIRRTMLYKQIKEIQQVRSAMRRSTHRHSLRMKRLAVRSRVFSELAHMQTERMKLMRETMQTMTRVNNLGRALLVHQRKLDRLQDQLKKQNEPMPQHLVYTRDGISAALDRAGIWTDSTNPLASVESLNFQSDLSKQLKQLIPQGTQGDVIREMTDIAFKDSMDKIKAKGPSNTEDEVALPQEQLVASLVKELNLSEKELNEMLDKVGGGSASGELKKFVINALKQDSVELEK